MNFRAVLNSFHMFLIFVGMQFDAIAISDSFSVGQIRSVGMFI